MATTNKILVFILAICLFVPSSFAFFDNGMPFYYINMASNTSNITSLNYSQIAANIGNWSADKPSYATLVYIGGLNNLSQSTVQNLINANGNWTLDKTSYSTTAQANGLYYPLNNNLFGYYNTSTLPAQINYYPNITQLQLSLASEVVNRTSLGNYSASASGLYANISAKGNGNITGAGAIGNLSYWSNSTNLQSSILFVNTTTKTIGINVLSSQYIFSVLGNVSLVGTPQNNTNSATGLAGLQSIYIYAGQGGNTTITTGTAVGGSGNFITIQAGKGGQATSSTGTTRGAQGGTLFLLGGDGGDAFKMGSNPQAGMGGSVYIKSGENGVALNGTFGTTGHVFILGANGTNVSYAPATPSGGSITIRPGNGGTNSVTTSSASQTGGTLYLYSGDAGRPTNGTVGQSAGDIIMNTGSGTTAVNASGGNGGAITVTAGNGGSPSAQQKNAGKGGGATFTAGNGGSVIGNATPGDGGSFSFQGGSAGGDSSSPLLISNATGGNILFLGGNGGGISANNSGGFAGNILFRGGTSGNSSRVGNIYFGINSLSAPLLYGKVMFGSNTTPTEMAHFNIATATAVYEKFTAGTTTGTTSTDGFNVGISATGEAQVRQYENLNLTIWTNNVGQITVANNGTLFFNNYTGAGNQYLCVNSGGQLYRNTTCA